jgi:hypothetical protein
MIGGVLMIAVGAYFLFIGLGKARVSKNPEANAAFLKRWGLFFCVAGPILAIAGIATLFVA